MAAPRTPSPALTTTLITPNSRRLTMRLGHQADGDSPFHRAVDVTTISVRPTSIQPARRMRNTR